MNSSQVTGECLTLPGTAREQSSLGVNALFRKPAERSTQAPTHASTRWTTPMPRG